MYCSVFCEVLLSWHGRGSNESSKIHRFKNFQTVTMTKCPSVSFPAPPPYPSWASWIIWGPRNWTQHCPNRPYHIYSKKSHTAQSSKVLERYECSENHICSKSRKCFVPSKIWKSKDGKIQNVEFWKFKMYWTDEFRMNCYFLSLVFLNRDFCHVTVFNWMFALRRRRTTIACTYVNIICRYVYVICKNSYTKWYIDLLICWCI